jgi:hypothetical protein
MSDERLERWRTHLATQTRWREAGISYQAIFAIVDQWEREEITYSRMIEAIREQCEASLLAVLASEHEPR